MRAASDQVQGPPPYGPPNRDVLAGEGKRFMYVDIIWRGNKVWFGGDVHDRPGDGTSTAIQARYRVKLNGKWRTHKRYVAHAYKGGVDEFGWLRSRHPTRKLWVRLCSFDNGNALGCGQRH